MANLTIEIDLTDTEENNMKSIDKTIKENILIVVVRVVVLLIVSIT